VPLAEDLSEFCIDLKRRPGEICITMPGGLRMCAKVSLDVPDLSDNVLALFGELNGALAPLKPIFDVLDLVKAIVDCVKAIPAAFGPPPDPSQLIECVPVLVKKLDALLRLLPPASLFLMLKEVVTALLLFVVGVRSRIQLMLDRIDRIIEAETKAATLGSVELQEVLDCASGNLDIQLENLNDGCTPVSRLIGTINAFFEIAGLPICIPNIGAFDELTEDALVPLDFMINLLQSILGLIPTVPGGGFGEGTTKACD
jgi:hypothetical protein